MSAPLTDLAAGHIFEPFSLSIDPQRVRAYLGATGDALSVYEAGGVAPPLAVAAVALGVLLESVSLPAGSLHASESLQCRAPVLLGAVIECNATLAQRSQRRGWVVSVLECDVALAGEVVLITRATILTPVPEA